ncbi:hypothetical protein K488DRAFT_59259, partial [Vararia minispora EC-137]
MYVDSSAQIWSIYLHHAAKEDRALMESWKGDMDGILIFVRKHVPLLSCSPAGLFSAVITAFAVVSYQWLQADNSAAIASILAKANGMTVTTDTCPPDNTSCFEINLNPSEPFPLLVNACWLLSLVFSLSCALAATLIQQWARAYLHSTQDESTPHARARRRTYALRGARKFRVQAVVEGVPLLLHISLILFFVGLIVFLWEANTANPVLAIVVLICIILFV